MNNIAVWDADFIPFYCCNSKDKDIVKSLEQCIIDCDILIQSINSQLNCEYFIGFLTKGKCFRYNIYPAYKGNRKYDSLPTYINEVRDHMINNYGFMYIEGYEADDLVMSYKRQSVANCIIVSPDKDILNLEGTHYNPRKNEFVVTDKEAAELYFWKSMMIGDTTDNIKGIQGIGPANADRIIKNKELFSSLKATVLDEYCKRYGEESGIINFYVNYRCLKIVDNVYFDDLLNVKLNKVEELSE